MLKLHASKIIIFTIILLSIILIILKVLKIINWDWKWILSPLWASFSFAVIGFMFWYFIILVNSK